MNEENGNKESINTAAQPPKISNIPKIVDIAFDFYDAVTAIVHPPKSEKQLYIDAIKLAQKDFPKLAPYFQLPEKYR